MASSRLTLNDRTLQNYLDGDYGVASLLRASAERVLSAAKADPHDDTGAYENSLHIEEEHTDRLSVRVVASVYYAHVLEANYGILARALDSA